MVRWFESCSAGLNQDIATDATGQARRHPTQIALSNSVESLSAHRRAVLPKSYG
jgi:hypothetical protein